MPLILQHPEWQAMNWLVHGFSTRQGGHSAVYGNNQPGKGDLNLGFTPADDRETVLENRRLLLEELIPNDPAEVTTISQIHSPLVHAVDSNHPPAPPGDGLVTATPGVYLAILTADCVPILIVDETQRAVAAIHAGWRGTVKRIVENGIQKMQMEYGSRPQNLTALIGPAIGACCYSVGEELRQAFTAEFSYAGDLFEKKPQLASEYLHLDLTGANRLQLTQSGLRPNSIHKIGGCTSCHPELYFSHRQSHGHTGRMMSVVGMRTL